MTQAAATMRPLAVCSAQRAYDPTRSNTGAQLGTRTQPNKAQRFHNLVDLSFTPQVPWNMTHAHMAPRCSFIGAVQTYRVPPNYWQIRRTARS